VLEGKRILLAVSGGIAAYKTPELVRRLKQRGAEVRVALTEHASHFVTPLTLQAVSGEPVLCALMDPAAEASMSHIELAKWADLILVAPATANLLAKHAHGIADDLISTLLLATPAPVAMAPAMNQQMYQALATQANLATLAKRGVMLWGPAAGEQACGDVGPGRMLEPSELAQLVDNFLNPVAPLLAGKKVTITAGPTREAIDPVRYISNHSSGKMGYALARAAAKLGAEVTLISGPVNLPTPAGCDRVNVESAIEMHDASLAASGSTDIFIACAAVADYRLAEVATQKIKKSNESMALHLVRNPDIVAAVAAQPNRPFTVGFAAETQDVAYYAQDKLTRKGLDMIAANDVSNPEQGFNSDNNALQVFWLGGQQTLPLADKHELAEHLIQLIATRYIHETN
jgi:phosphopantothenoylcysteine decarboxylase/phosphopantothenate--cysteine ligase